MRPAISVILLTTLIGAGQGLFLALFTAQSYALFDLLPVQGSRSFYVIGSVLALALLTAGLAASFFHLGRPERAWRSAAQWRTSWLSREVIVLPAFMGAVLLYGLAHWSGQAPVLAILPGGIPIDVTVLLGIAGSLLAFLLFVCTGMIYASLRFLPEWHSPLTVINYTLLGGASGFTLATSFASHAAPELTGFFGGWALIITLLGLVGRSASLLRNARLVPKSSLQTAIGIKHPVIAQRSQGFTGGSFNTREFFHGQTAALFSSIKWLFLLGAFVMPAGLLALGLLAHSDSALALAALVQYCGLLAERWFFFAQANHPQNIYYQRIS
ncbi:DMSO reductase anchor subunit (DmsC) [mine drainage metagenome]|uniref:DMSO reductase anchor subunit (DmsC) n=1 Tax=mine drainage metagenome TaxID=410659 RepID=A0A1J5S733_9ZZZZ